MESCGRQTPRLAAACVEGATRDRTIGLILVTTEPSTPERGKGTNLVDLSPESS